MGKASSPDGTQARVFKMCAMELSSIIHFIFWDSLRSAQIPMAWKISTIILVSKQPRPSKPYHYRLHLPSLLLRPWKTSSSTPLSQLLDFCWTCINLPKGPSGEWRMLWHVSSCPFWNILSHLGPSHPRRLTIIPCFLHLWIKFHCGTIYCMSFTWFPIHSCIILD